MLAGKAILSFLFSPAGRALLIVLAFTGWTMYQRHDAATQAADACQADVLRQQITEQNRQLAAARAVAAAAREKANQTEAELSQLRTEADALRKSLSGVPDIPPDVRERLRNIR